VRTDFGGPNEIKSEFSAAMARSIIMSMSGILAICVIATALIPVPAPSTIQIQATAMTETRAATTTKRSRRKAASRSVVSPGAIAVLGPLSGAAKPHLVFVIAVEQTVLVPSDMR
jgi:hypothetical protein